MVLIAQLSATEEFKKRGSGLHSFIGSRMNHHLRSHVDERGLGYVFKKPNRERRVHKI